MRSPSHVHAATCQMTTPTKAPKDTLAEQVLALVEILSAQNHEIANLTQRCVRLEHNDQAATVAFTTFFHILSAGNVSGLGSMANVFGRIINEAEALDLPQDSVALLRSIEMTLRTAQGSGASSTDKRLLSAQES